MPTSWLEYYGMGTLELREPSEQKGLERARIYQKPNTLALLSAECGRHEARHFRLALMRNLPTRAGFPVWDSGQANSV
ncbi:hypothetical protein HJFPF1_11425 [Paramyrothecium foliicola]|nr:hypothetical protein HJFPF1_11425 [Paramyrothecium foliicola]